MTIRRIIEIFILSVLLACQGGQFSEVKRGLTGGEKDQSAHADAGISEEEPTENTDNIAEALPQAGSDAGSLPDQEMAEESIADSAQDQEMTQEGVGADLDAAACLSSFDVDALMVGYEPGINEFSLPEGSVLIIHATGNAQIDVEIDDDVSHLAGICVLSLGNSRINLEMESLVHQIYYHGRGNGVSNFEFDDGAQVTSFISDLGGNNTLKVEASPGDCDKVSIVLRGSSQFDCGS